MLYANTKLHFPTLTTHACMYTINIYVHAFLELDFQDYALPGVSHVLGILFAWKQSI